MTEREESGEVGGPGVLGLGHTWEGADLCNLVRLGDIRSPKAG